MKTKDSNLKNEDRCIQHLIDYDMLTEEEIEIVDNYERARAKKRVEQRKLPKEKYVKSVDNYKGLSPEDKKKLFKEETARIQAQNYDPEDFNSLDFIFYPEDYGLDAIE